MADNSEKLLLLQQNWQEFVSRWRELNNLSIEPDSEWPSPCEYEQDGNWFWRPVKQEEQGENNDFSNVESAIGYPLDSQYTSFFCQFYSDNLDAEHDNGPLQYLQAWSKQDFERLQQNLIGHLLMKQRLKQTPTLFFALTDEEDLNIVVDNVSGSVCLEYVGQEPHKTIAKDLATFISQTRPTKRQ